MFVGLRPRARTLGTLAAFGLAAGGVLTLASSAMYAVVAALADEYVAGRGGDAVVTTSWAFARGMDGLVRSSAVLLVLSVYVLAYALSRHALAPRWLGWVAVASVAPFLAAVVTQRRIATRPGC